MSTTQKPEALRIADAAANAGDAGYPTAKKANAYYLCLLDDCAQMIRKLHAENTTLQAGDAAARLEIESLRARSVEPAGEYPALPLAITSAPERIWLDLGFNPWEEDAHFSNLHRPTWSADNATGDGIEYVRADRAMRAAQPAGVQQPGAAYAELPSPIAWAHWEASGFSEEPTRLAIKTSPPDEHEKRVANWFQIHSTDQMRTFADATHALRASHGQAPAAPAQAAPAAVAGPSDAELPDVEDMAHSAVQEALSFGVNHDVLHRWMRAVMDKTVEAMLATAPTTQPAPAIGHMSPSKEWLENRLAIADDSDVHAGVPPKKVRPCDTPHGCNGRNCLGCDDFKQSTTQPAPQQEAQEPVMIYLGGCTIDCGEHGHHNVELLRMIPAGSKLYTKPQPSPASQGDALDAERLDWLNEDDENHVSKVGKTWYTRPAYGRPYRKHKNLRAAIDAARAAQEGK